MCKCIQTNVERIRELASTLIISLPFQIVLSWKKHLEGSHLSYLELNNCCVKEDITIISGHILCRIFIQ